MELEVSLWERHQAMIQQAFTEPASDMCLAIHTIRRNIQTKACPQAVYSLLTGDETPGTTLDSATAVVGGGAGGRLE